MRFRWRAYEFECDAAGLYTADCDVEEAAEAL
jgi:hypothetical protein